MCLHVIQFEVMGISYITICVDIVIVLLLNKSNFLFIFQLKMHDLCVIVWQQLKQLLLIFLSTIYQLSKILL